MYPRVLLGASWWLLQQLWLQVRCIDEPAAAQPCSECQELIIYSLVSVVVYLDLALARPEWVYRLSMMIYIHDDLYSMSSARITSTLAERRQRASLPLQIRPRGPVLGSSLSLRCAASSVVLPPTIFACSDAVQHVAFYLNKSRLSYS